MSVKKKTDTLSKISDFLQNINWSGISINIGKGLKYFFFNFCLKMIMYAFEILTIFMFAYLIVFLVDAWVQYKTGLNMIMLSKDQIELNRALNHSSSLISFLGPYGKFITVITALISTVSAVFVKLISHIRKN